MEKKTAIVSTYYPSSGGVATYTKYLFEEVRKLDKDVVVLADNVDKSVEEDERVIRCWDHSPRYVCQIYEQIRKHGIDRVHFQQELHLYGEKITAVMLPFFILFLRLLGKETIITLHGVVPLKEVTKNFIKESGYLGHPVVVRLALQILYCLLCLSSQKIIVHELQFKEMLKDYFVNMHKIHIVRHGVKSLTTLRSKNVARRRVGIENKKYTFLYFGYVAGYKGMDMLITALKGIEDDDFNLIVVGSEHPRLKHEHKYREYYKSVQEYLTKDRRCMFTGYVPEEEIDYYFRAADCAIFPYKVHMSSSGPMALAIANEILCIASEVFTGVLIDELIFMKNASSLADMLKKAKSGKLEQYRDVIKEMKKDLSWGKIAKDTREVWTR